MKIEYNQKQLEAINSKENRVLVTAPAGSGKTSTLVGAIQKYSKDNPNDSIVAITFTKKAAAELRARLFGYSVLTATIHSWSLIELNKLGVKYKFKVSLLQDDQIQEILKQLSRQCGYYSMNYFLLTAYIMGNYNLDISQGTKQKYEKVLRKYIAYKRDNQLYDFTDLPLYLYDMLNKFNEKIENIDGLFVDEFQDVDDVQARIFTKIDAKKFFYIGDIDQSIYIFRGAGPHNLKSLTNFTHYKLNINYRSYQSIINFATQIHSNKKISTILDINSLKPCDIICARKDDLGEVYIDQKYNAYDLVNNVSIPLYTALSAFMLKKPYILCRSNKQVKAIQTLGYNNVSTIHQAKGLEYTNVIVVDFELNGEEEINIGYVACTRARDGLFVLEFDSLVDYLPDILAEYNYEIIGHNLF